MTNLSAYNTAVRIPVAALAAGMLATLALTACSSASSSSPAAAGTQSAKTAATSTSATCQLVSAVLADGPDPDADPVGYAEAQIDPLRGIHTQDAALQSAIGKLAGAYEQFFTSNGSHTAKEAVAVASSKINDLCPGAAS